MKQDLKAKRIQGFQRQGGKCVFQSQSGGFTDGGAGKTPAGDYSANTNIAQLFRVPEIHLYYYHH
jgi:hypothetical protein